ncbi:MAG: hypothetical protein ABSC92_05040 [Rhizomicrobium sp.]|jgi:hypothetical protein
MKFAFTLAAVSALLLASTAATPAVAVSPIIQGTYLTTYVDICQATFENNPEGSGINTINNGNISSTTGMAVFDSTTHKVKITGFQNSGTLLIVEGLGGTPMTNAPFSLNTKYEVGPQFFTLNGMQFNAAYSSPTGVVTSFIFSGMDKAGCATTGTAQLTTSPD